MPVLVVGLVSYDNGRYSTQSGQWQVSSLTLLAWHTNVEKRPEHGTSGDQGRGPPQHLQETAQAQREIADHTQGVTQAGNHRKCARVIDLPRLGEFDDMSGVVRQGGVQRLFQRRYRSFQRSGRDVHLSVRCAKAV